MPETGTTLSLRPTAEREPPEGVDDPAPPVRDWFHEAVPSVSRRSPWKAAPRVGMK